MVGLPIVSNKRCSQSHKGILPITETKICAGGKRDQGVCEVRVRWRSLRSFLVFILWLWPVFFSIHLTERLRWPIGVPGRRKQGHSGRKHQRAWVCRHQASCCLCQRGLLLWMDPQSLQILFGHGNKLLDCYIFQCGYGFWYLQHEDHCCCTIGVETTWRPEFGFRLRVFFNFFFF